MYSSVSEVFYLKAGNGLRAKNDVKNLGNT